MEQNNKVMIFRPSWKNFFFKYLLIFAILALIIFVIFSGWFSVIWKEILCIVGAVGIIFICLKIIIVRLDECFTVKEDEVAVEHGILNKKSIEIGIHQIRTIQVQQKIIQRLFDIGDIYIASAGTEGYEIIAHGINKPHEIRDKLQSYMRSASPASEKDSKHE